MPLSGYVGAGATDALQQVLERRMKELQRQDAERQHAEQLQIQRQQIDLQRRTQDALQEERLYNRNRQDQQDKIAAAGRTFAATPVGPTTPEAAAVMRQDPALAPLVPNRKIINAFPIGGAPPLDTSGPQELPDQYDRMPTAAEAEKLRLQEARRHIGEQFSHATDEAGRRAAGAEAFGAGLDPPNELLAQTGTEKTAQQLEAEQRAEERWKRENAITNAQANARQASANEAALARAAEARDQKEPTSAQNTLASYATRLEQAEPTMQSLETTIQKMNPLSFEAQVRFDQPILQSKEIQQYMQASRNLINATLRRESGAVISPSEFAEARKQYLPQPGDDKQTLAMKRANRQVNMATFKRGAGRAYQSIDEALGGINTGQGSGKPAPVVKLVIDPKTGQLVEQKVEQK